MAGEVNTEGEDSEQHFPKLIHELGAVVGEQMARELLCMTPPAKPVNHHFAHPINQALRSCDHSPSSSFCRVRYAFGGQAALT